MKRAIERFVVCPLANHVSSSQVRLGTVVVIDIDPGVKKLAFFRDDDETSIAAASLQSARSPK